MYILYQTRCLVNDKIYIGVHNGKSESYLGSGTAISAAIRKYGPDKFVRETIGEFETAAEAFSAEHELVTEEFVNREDNYNMQVGGLGGNTPSEKSRKLMSEAASKRRISEEGRAKLREVRSGSKNPMYGKKRSLESRLKQGESRKGITFKRNNPELVCPKCGKEGKGPNMGRYHFDNCGVKRTGEIKHKVVKCLYCPKEGATHLMRRYHFDNCKFRPT